MTRERTRCAREGAEVKLKPTTQARLPAPTQLLAIRCCAMLCVEPIFVK